MSGPHKERNRTERIGWLRAAVLGANDGIVSTASLVLGVAAAHGTRSNVLVAGVAGLVAGAMAMAAGEYVSVHSQADTEHAELKRESAELKADDKGEHEELTAIYVDRGLDPSLAKQVAEQLMAHDALGAIRTAEMFLPVRAGAQFVVRPIRLALSAVAQSLRSAQGGHLACRPPRENQAEPDRGRGLEQGRLSLWDCSA
jgi:VIT1/CCC1 family predicted Fe2+/Mn2+ transporter